MENTSAQGENAELLNIKGTKDVTTLLCLG
jgi:hypothetical protein